MGNRNETTNRRETMKTRTAYRVYFLGVSACSREDVFASSKFEAEAMIASKYGLAHSISSHII